MPEARRSSSPWFVGQVPVVFHASLSGTRAARSETGGDLAAAAKVHLVRRLARPCAKDYLAGLAGQVRQGAISSAISHLLHLQRQNFRMSWLVARFALSHLHVVK